MSVKKAEEMGMYSGFKVGSSGLSVSNPQYIYDTLFIGEETMDNLLAIKSVPRCFKLACGLRVNFAKSCVMGITVDSAFLGMVDTLLHCSMGSIPFKYLGLLVGANPRRISI